MVVASLQQLRNAIQREEKIDLTSNEIVLQNTALDRKKPTNFLSMRGRGTAYALDAVYFQWKLRDMQYNDYVQACGREGVAHVMALDKRDMLAYLAGEISQCAGLVEKPDESESSPAPPDIIATPASAEPAPSADDAVVAADTANTHRLPREQRSIDSVLMFAEWDFTPLREKLAKHIASAKRSKPAPDRARDAKASTFDPRGDRYTNNENRFWRENMGKDFQQFGINPTGSFAAAKKAQSSSAAPSTNTPEAPAASAEQRPQRRSSSSAPSSRKRKAVDPAELRPIVIVPGSGMSLLNSMNAKEFVESGHFISEDDMRKQGIAPDLSGRIKALRSPGRNCSVAEYLLVSNINRLSEAEWKRVVAVVCTGKQWQFKNWPIKGDVVEVLRQVQGFFFHYDDVVPDQTAASWAVKLIPISRSKRHNDGHAQLQFFSSLDTFIERTSKRVRY